MSSFDVLTRTAESGLAAHQVPGAALGVWHAGSEQTAAAGTANVEAGPPVTADTRFLIASNTKPFTAVTAMRLVEQGKLDLHAPLRRYVP
jgi:CubicO group peptidase (beta-lactamase class C family)